MLTRSLLTFAVVLAASQVDAQEGGRQKAEPSDIKGKPGFQGVLVGYDKQASTLIVGRFDKLLGNQRTTFVVAKDVKVIVDNDKTIKIDDLPDMAQMDLYLNEDKTTILGIRAEGPTFHTDHLQVVDAQKQTITIKQKNEVTSSVAADAKIIINGQAATLADVKPNLRTMVKMSVDQKSVVGIAQGKGVDGEKVVARQGKPGDVVGRVKAVDAGTITLTVIATKIAPEEDKTFELAKDVKILISSQEGKLADLSAKFVAITLKDAKVALVQTIEESSPESIAIQGLLKAQSGEKNTITLTVPGPKGQPPEDRTFDVEKEAKILVDHTKPAKLADLPLGSQIFLSLSKEQKAIGIVAVGPTLVGTLKMVDAGKYAVTVIINADKRIPGEERTVAVAKDAGISFDKTKEFRLSDLPVGSRITLTLGLDQKSAIAVSATTTRPEVFSVSGVLSGFDVANNKVTINVSKGKGQPGEDQTHIVPKEARVLIDFDRPGKLADLKNGATVTLDLSADLKVVTLRAVGPNLVGFLKSVDTTKNILTVTVNASKTSPGEDKGFEIARDARFSVGKQQVRLADLSVGMRVTLSMSIDGKEVIGARVDP